MPRGLDHIVHAVRDLDAAAALYRRLGFTIGARNRHAPEWGTQNHIVQLPGFFVELLAIADPIHIAPHRDDFFSFGAFNRDFLARQEGLAMLVLESRDARRDAEDFRAAGIGDFQVYDFERPAKRPDGTRTKVGFSLAFAVDPRTRDVGFFACQQHHPENFWNPAFQVHANTAASVAGVVLVAENPADHHIFLSAFTGQRELLATSAGISVPIPRGEIQIMNPVAFQDRYGAEPPDCSSGARLAALRFGVRDLRIAQGVIRGAEIATLEHMGRAIVRPDIAMGVTLTFEQI
jgi:hypothetical protein